MLAIHKNYERSKSALAAVWCLCVHAKKRSIKKQQQWFCLHFISTLLYYDVLAYPGAPQLPYITLAQILYQQAQDRVSLESPLREVDTILQHSRAVVQEAPFCLKVNCCLLSVLHEMGGDSSQRCSEGRIQKATHKHAFDPHTQTGIFV